MGGQGYRHNFMMFLCGSWTIGNLLRETLTTKSNFEVAERHLMQSWLIAPAYITIASGMSPRATQINRSRRSQQHPLRLCDNDTPSGFEANLSFASQIKRHKTCRKSETCQILKNGEVFLYDKLIEQHATNIVQTNVDHWQKFPDFMKSLARRKMATEILDSISTKPSPSKIV